MLQDQSTLGRALSSLAYADFRRLASSMLLMSLATQLLQTIILWQIYQMTGSALLLGLSGLARAAPHMVLSLIGGVIADRLDRIYLIQAGQIANIILLSTLAILSLTGAVEVWHLYVITFLNSAFSAATQPGRTAIIPSLVPQSNLVNAIALNATIGQTSQFIGPAIAGVMIATVGLGLGYLASSMLFLGATAAVIGIRVQSAAPSVSESPWHSFVKGIAFVTSRPVIVSLLLLDLGATLLGSYRALLPIFAAALGVGAAGYGLLSAAPGIGSIVGSGLMLALGDMKYKGLYTVFGVLAYSIALAMLGLSPWFLISLIAAGLLGATNSVQMIPRNTVILAISPSELRGRVEAFRSMMAGGGPPIGYTLSGLLAALFGAPAAVVMGAISCAVLVTVLGVFHSELRQKELGSPITSGEPSKE